MARLINEEDVIAVLNSLECNHLVDAINEIPTASDWDRYSTALWKEAYERGKKDATQTNTPNALETLDCVSRQAAIDGAVSLRLFDRDVKIVAVDYIKGLPTAQPERKRGRWSGPFCSKCGISKYNFVKILHTDDGPCGKWNYCPNCGSFYGGEQDDR